MQRSKDNLGESSPCYHVGPENWTQAIRPGSKWAAFPKEPSHNPCRVFSWYLAAFNVTDVDTQFSLLYSTSGFVVFFSSLSGLGVLVLYFWVFYCCSLIPFSLLHSEDWRCPGVAGALLSLCCAVVSHLPLVPLSITAALCWLYVIVRHVCICHWVSAVSASDVCFISLWCRRWNLG